MYSQGSPASVNSDLALNGGCPTRDTPWPTYDKGDVILDNDELAAAARVIGARLLFRYDLRQIEKTEVGRFEEGLRHFFGAKYALAVSSGTAALALSFMSLGVQSGDEVLCSAFGFPASPSSVLLAGGTPILVDIDDNLHMDLDDLERKISKRTKAILVVHMRGQVGNISRLMEIADEKGIPVVEDAIPILGAKIADRYVGTFGKFGAFSTQSDKSLNTGEGGFLLTDDRRLFEKAVLLSGAYEGRVKKHCDWEIGVEESSLPLFNFRMDELRGAIATAQLAKLPDRIRKLRSTYDRAVESLSIHGELVVRKSFFREATLGDNITLSLSESDGTDAQWFADALCAEGIDSRCFGLLGKPNARSFWNWRFMFPGKSKDQIRALLPRATHLLDRAVDIPLSPTLTDADVLDLSAAIGKILQRRQLRRGNISGSRHKTEAGFTFRGPEQEQAWPTSGRVDPSASGIQP